MLPVIATINHLLAQEPSARQQLLRHAGKLAVIDTGAFALRLRVAADGMLESAPADAPASVTIGLKLADLALIAQQPERAFSYVRIDGDAEFANAISQLSKTVRWDAGYDLERLFGPIAAERLVAGAQAGVARARAGGRKLAANVAEFLVEEQPLLVHRRALDAFSSDVARLRDDVERSAKRLARLEQKLAQKIPQTLPQTMTTSPLDPTT